MGYLEFALREISISFEIFTNTTEKTLSVFQYKTSTMHMSHGYRRSGNFHR